MGRWREITDKGRDAFNESFNAVMRFWGGIEPTFSWTGAYVRNPNKEADAATRKKNFREAKEIADFISLLVSMAFITGVWAFCFAKLSSKISLFDYSSLFLTGAFSLVLSVVLSVRIFAFILGWLLKDSMIGPLVTSLYSCLHRLGIHCDFARDNTYFS
jgi:hypothetical protein